GNPLNAPLRPPLRPLPGLGGASACALVPGRDQRHRIHLLSGADGRDAGADEPGPAGRLVALRAAGDAGLGGGRCSRLCAGLLRHRGGTALGGTRRPCRHLRLGARAVRPLRRLDHVRGGLHAHSLQDLHHRRRCRRHAGAALRAGLAGRTGGALLPGGRPDRLGRAEDRAGAAPLHRNRGLGRRGDHHRRHHLVEYARMSTSAARALLVLLLVSLLAACGHSRAVKRESVRPVTPAERGSLEVPSDGRYTVRKGDALAGIDFRHGLDHRGVAAWNGIRAPYTIYPGQRLLLRGRETKREVAVTPTPPVSRPTPPVTTPTTPVTTPTTTPGTPPVTTPTPPPARPPATTPPASSGSPGGWQWPTQGQIIGRYVAGDPKRQGLDIAGQAGQPVVAAAAGTVVYSGAGLVGYGDL